MTERLSRPTLDQLPAELKPAYDPSSLRLGIVHLGVGAFHRAHQAVYTDAAIGVAGGDWGICAVAPRSAQTLEQLVPQDGLYSVLVRSPDGSAPSIRVMGPLVDVLGARQQPDAVLDRLADPSVAVVSLTVTEKAYHLAAGTGRVDLADPEIRSDLATARRSSGDGKAPVTVPGLLLAGLRRRAETHARPLTVLCCDNILDGGSVLSGVIRELVDALPDADPVLATYLAERVSFPTSMVDRITPATTETDRTDAAHLLGVRDEAVVAPEAFSEWVIEDRFAGPRPAWERAGAVIAGDISPWQVRKLRVLNAGHSLIAYVGRLLGYETVGEAVANDAVVAAFRRLITDDVALTLPPVPGGDLQQYSETVLERFANPSIAYRNEQVGSDGSQKVPQRLLGIVRDDLAAGHDPRWAALAVAAWLRYLAGTDEQGGTIGVNDPLAERLVPIARAVSASGRVATEQLHALAVLGDDLADNPRLAGLLTEWLTAFARHGVADTLHASL